MPRRIGWTRLELALLGAVARQPEHAYAIARELKRSRGSVADALKRLESMGIVRSKWDTSEGRPGPPRRIYSLTAKGRREHAKIAEAR